MTTKLILATIAAFAVASSATAAPTHRKAHASSGSAATKALNEKSLQQASAGSTAMPMGGSPNTMSDSGSANAAMPTAPGAAMAPGAAPMGTPATAPVGTTGDTMTPPATPVTPAPPQ